MQLSISNHESGHWHKTKFGLFKSLDGLFIFDNIKTVSTVKRAKLTKPN